MNEFDLWSETRKKIHDEVVGDTGTAELSSQQLFDVIDRTAIAVHQSVGRLEQRIAKLEKSDDERSRRFGSSRLR